MKKLWISIRNNVLFCKSRYIENKTKHSIKLWLDKKTKEKKNTKRGAKAVGTRAYLKLDFLTWWKYSFNLGVEFILPPGEFILPPHELPFIQIICLTIRVFLFDFGPLNKFSFLSNFLIYLMVNKVNLPLN